MTVFRATTTMRQIFLALAFPILLLASPLAAQDENGEKPLAADEEHEKLFFESRFPAATTCATCHPDHYREWSVSPHSYAQMSPVFNAFHGAVMVLTNGTNGDFCIRCHDPVGMNLGEPEFMSNMDRHPTSREGVTCIACHRLNRAYGKLSGRLAIVEGDLFEPVYGPTGNAELERVLDSGEYRVNTERGKAGRAIHTKAEKFFQLTSSSFCGTCHDVNLVNGFRLEEAFSEFKNSPAARQKISCNDCHMATVPGVDSPYAEEPAAVIGGKPTKPRKRTNHMFIGPDYSPSAWSSYASPSPTGRARWSTNRAISTPTATSVTAIRTTSTMASCRSTRIC